MLGVRSGQAQQDSKEQDKSMVILHCVLDSIFCGILVVDKDGKIVVFNNSARKIFNMSDKELDGKDIRQVEVLKDIFQLMVENRGQGRHKFPFKDTSLIINFNPINSETEMGTVAIIHESTKSQCIDQELAVTENLLKEINVFLESSFDGILVTDKRGRVIRINSAWEKMFSISRKDVLGKTTQELIKRGVYEQSAAQKAVETGKVATVMFENRGRKIIATGNPVYDGDGQLTSAVVNVRDITELENLRQQLERQQKLAERYSNEIKEMRRQQQQYSDIICQSKEMRQVMDMVSRVAEVDATVLVTGESGVGKEVVVRYIHRLSHRKDGPLVKINCGAIPPSLIESEMFGYEPGAFTGARKQGKMGLFELANGGTLFLDEIGEVNLDMQVKLLRAIQDREIIKIGSVKPIQIDTRIIAATNRDLKKMIKEGKFREDLFYRLNVINIHIQPLRCRKDDIAPLLRYFLRKYNAKYGKSKRFSNQTVNVLIDYSWPGNIRELENLVENLVVLVTGEEILPEHLPEYCFQSIHSEEQVFVKGILPLKTAKRMLEKQLLTNAQEKYQTTREIAQALEVNQSTVVRKLNAFTQS